MNVFDKVETLETIGAIVIAAFNLHKHGKAHAQRLHHRTRALLARKPSAAQRERLDGQRPHHRMRFIRGGRR